jgi:hypothetical protein
LTPGRRSRPTADGRPTVTLPCAAASKPGQTKERLKNRVEDQL